MRPLKVHFIYQQIISTLSHCNFFRFSTRQGLFLAEIEIIVNQVGRLESVEMIVVGGVGERVLYKYYVRQIARY